MLVLYQFPSPHWFQNIIRSEVLPGCSLDFPHQTTMYFIISNLTIKDICYNKDLVRNLNVNILKKLHLAIGIEKVVLADSSH